MMYENPLLTARKKRLDRTNEIIKNLENGTEINKAIAIIEYNLGVSENNARNYLKIFSNLGFIELRDGKIFKKENDPK